MEREFIRNEMGLGELVFIKNILEMNESYSRDYYCYSNLLKLIDEEIEYRDSYIGLFGYKPTFKVNTINFKELINKMNFKTLIVMRDVFYDALTHINDNFIKCLYIYIENLVEEKKKISRCKSHYSMTEEDYEIFLSSCSEKGKEELASSCNIEKSELTPKVLYKKMYKEIDFIEREA